MHVFLAILLSILGFVGGFGPGVDGDLPTPGGISGSGDTGSDTGWTAAAYIWRCHDPEACPDDIACPQCPKL